MALAANRLGEVGGGVVLFSKGKELALVEMPIAGLMSDERAEIVAAKAEKLTEAMRDMGCTPQQRLHAALAAGAGGHPGTADFRRRPDRRDDVREGRSVRLSRRPALRARPTARVADGQHLERRGDDDLGDRADRLAEAAGRALSSCRRRRVRPRPGRQARAAGRRATAPGPGCRRTWRGSARRRPDLGQVDDRSRHSSARSAALP